MPNIPYSPEEDAYIVAHYATLGPRYCGRYLQRKPESIYHRSKTLGLPRVTLNVRHRLAGAAIARRDPSQEIPVLVETFSHVRTPEAAYILGLLWADGYIHPEKVVLSCLRMDALDYMTTFAATGTWRSHDYQKSRYGIPMQPSRVIQLGHTALATYLRTKGYASKSHESACAILATIPAHFQSYWFRGLFDGDGYIKNDTSTIKITSSYEQDWTYLIALCVKLEIVYRIRQDRYVNRHGKINSRSVLSINNASGVKTFCDYIYRGRDQDGIGLKRKYIKWLELVVHLKTRPRVSHLFV